MPCRVEDLEQRFYRSKAAINEIFYETLECFILWASPLVSVFQRDFLRSRAQLYARKLAAKSRNATQNCVGFIDGTLIEIARLPSLIQRVTYSGHKRRPGLKRQVVTNPDGLLFHVFGPFEGSRHDMHLYAESGPDDVLAEGLLIDGAQYYLSGDAGFALRPYLITPFEGAVLTPDEALFNRRMSKVRVSVEWAFKDVKKYFSHVAVPRKMVLSRTPAGAWYLASCLL
jgi:nuclease HARBI1